MKTVKLIRNAGIGVASGIAASWVMNRFQTGLSSIQREKDSEQDAARRHKKTQQKQTQKQKQKESSASTTEKAADRLSEAVAGEPVSKPYRKSAGKLIHYAFGGFVGGLYGVAGSLYPNLRSGFGTAFGNGVWATADEAIVPAADLSKTPTKVPASKHAYSLASHLVFGAALEGTRRLIQRAPRLAQRHPQKQSA